jgi:hypothetical protein
VIRIVAALVALGIARLFPEHGLGLWLRLGAATLALLLPFAGAGASEALAWSLGAVFLALTVTFVVHASLTLTLILFAVPAASYAFFRRAGSDPGQTPLRRVYVRLAPRSERGQAPGHVRSWQSVRSFRPGSDPGQTPVLVLLAGVAFGIAIWKLAGPVQGDALFHLGRVRKLDDLGSLSLRAVDEFRDGGLHPGYAFPLWHGFLALVARLGGVDPTSAVRHESSLLAPVLFLVTYEAGRALFRSASLAWVVLAATLGLAALAPGHGGALAGLGLPATAAQYLLPAAGLALVFSNRPLPLASLSLGLALVHPTYAVYLLIVLCGYLAARAALAREDLRQIAYSVASVAAPTIAVSLWLRPLADESVRTVHGFQHGLERYPGQFDVFGPNSFRIAPELIDRRGAIAVAALALVPLAALACRARWAAFVLGATVPLLALALWPRLFVHFAHVVSLSQARRAIAFVPLPFALAGGAAVLARGARWAVPAAGLAAGIWLQSAYPGNFGYAFGSGGGPAVVVWWALFAGSAALVWGALARRPERFERRGLLAGLAGLLFVLPVAVHGFSRWSARGGGQQELTPGLVHALRTEVPKRAVVFSDPETSYRVAAYAPVYVVVAPPAHVADTRANKPYVRQAAARRFLRTGDLAIPRGYGATFLVLDAKRTRLKPALAKVYGDSRYTLYRLKAGP